MCILVVDDAPDAADALASMLRLQGHDARAAYGGAQALRLIEEGLRPQCVLLDLAMPDMSGGELARQLRLRHDADLVLIAVTGVPGIDVALSPEVAHVDHCLRKPVKMADLAKILPLSSTR